MDYSIYGLGLMRDIWKTCDDKVISRIIQHWDGCILHGSTCYACYIVYCGFDDDKRVKLI